MPTISFVSHLVQLYAEVNKSLIINLVLSFVLEINCNLLMYL